VEKGKEGKGVKTWPGGHFVWPVIRPTPSNPPTFVPHSNLSPRCSTNRAKAKKQKTLSLFPFQSSFYFFLNFFIFGKCKCWKSN
jgi:hypothetical protein